MNKQVTNSAWYHRNDCPEPGIYYLDPRLPIARHIEWTRSSGDTFYSSPEPDNYNYAILAPEPLDTKFIRNQVFYHDLHRQGWISVYFVLNLQQAQFTQWLEQQPWRSYWYCWRPPKLRPMKPLLWNRLHALELTLTEKLYLDGYYEKFVAKYPCDGLAEFIHNRLGPARADLKQLISVQIERELEYDT